MVALRRQQFAEAAKNLRTQGGFSMNMRTGKAPTQGWMVARRSDTDLEPIRPAEATGEGLRAIRGRHANAYAQEGHMGGWVDKDMGEVEPSKRFRRFMPAQAAMHEHGQKAMFNVGNQRSYWNSSHPDFAEGGLTAAEGAENRQTHMEWAQGELKKRHPEVYRQASPYF
jgi:hypothetical protein